MLHVDFEEQEGITVPYPPIYDGIRNNHGFIDLRGRPDLAEKVLEGAQSIALKNLPFFTLGCDLGSHEEQEYELDKRYVAGGYIQIARTEYEDILPNDYLALAYAIEQKLEPLATNDHWIIRFLHTLVRLNLDEFNEDISSLWIWFYACAASPSLALKSTEKCIESLHNTLLELSW